MDRVEALLRLHPLVRCGPGRLPQRGHRTDLTSLAFPWDTSSEDDLVYKKNVRSMLVILSVMAMVIFAAIFVPPYLNPPHEVFRTSVSYGSPFGFTMYLTLNATTVSPNGTILFTGWLNNTGGDLNLTAVNQWPYSQSLLMEKPCTPGWPMGIGIMKGQYDQENYSLGTPMQLQQPSYGCSQQGGAPSYFLFYPHSDMVIASINGNPTNWVIQTTFYFSPGSLSAGALSGGTGQSLPPGVYTAILVDEWGDVLATNFLVK